MKRSVDSIRQFENDQMRRSGFTMMNKWACRQSINGTTMASSLRGPKSSKGRQQSTALPLSLLLYWSSSYERREGLMKVGLRKLWTDSEWSSFALSDSDRIRNMEFVIKVVFLYSPSKRDLPWITIPIVCVEDMQIVLETKPLWRYLQSVRLLQFVWLP